MSLSPGQRSSRPATSPRVSHAGLTPGRDRGPVAFPLSEVDTCHLSSDSYTTKVHAAGSRERKRHSARRLPIQKTKINMSPSEGDIQGVATLDRRQLAKASLLELSRCSVCHVAPLVERYDTCLWLLSALCWLVVNYGEVLPEFFSVGSGGSQVSPELCCARFWLMLRCPLGGGASLG
ncbi:hypothetical protein Taro_044242, partial [Colocasia esculenta]|nr:hypothetical protein [Colocasia esculenta]